MSDRRWPWTDVGGAVTSCRRHAEHRIRSHRATAQRVLACQASRRYLATRAAHARSYHRFPGDVLGWFRLLVRRRRSRPKRPGQPDTVRSIRLLVLRLARENPALGLPPHPRRTARPGFRMSAASNVWEILRQAGIDARFLRSQADALLACDFFETVTLSGVRLYVLVTWNQAGELRGLDHQSSGD